MICSNCNENIADDSLVCSMCNMKTQEHNGSMRETEYESICSNNECRYPIYGDLKSCPRCNTPISKTEPLLGEVKQQGKSSNLITILNTYDSQVETKQMHFADSILLNRGLINPDDTSISSKEHVEIFKDVKTKDWYLKNLASNKSVFRRVKGTTSLEDGDVILIGKNTYFEVKLSQEEE